DGLAPRRGARRAHPLGAAPGETPAGRAGAGTLVATAVRTQLLVAVPGEDDRHVRRTLADTEVATSSARLAPLAGRAFVAPAPVDVELVDRDRLVVLGVGDRRLEQLQHMTG